MKKKFTVGDFQKWKEEGKKINMMNCYDYTWAALLDQTDIPLILVGDSLGMYTLGYSGTTPVTMDQMLHHMAAVVKGAPNTFIVGDLPFGSYNVSCEQAVENANRLMKEGNVDCIKLEGGVEMADKIEAITKAGIPVMGHLGLTPQTAAALGGWKIQGKNMIGAKKLIADIVAVEKAGAVCSLIECVPNPVGEAMINSVSIPTIGLGAGPLCAGFGIAFQDMFGLSDVKTKFCKLYANLGQQIIDGFNQFYKESQSGEYPAPENCYATTAELDMAELLAYGKELQSK